MRLIDAAVLAFLAVLAVCAVYLSIAVLSRGRFYRSLKPNSRPTRWVLISLLFLFAVFVIWFPVWMIWPDALVSRVLLVLFGVTFFVVTITLRWFSRLVDWFIERKGWPLR